MAVMLDNKQDRYRISREKVQIKAQDILDALDCSEGELSVLIVDDRRIEVMNSKYFGRKGPTNVISFSMREGEFSNISPDLLGDVVISAETAKREADSIGISMNERLIQLLVHGILHIFGYDHEKSDHEALIMEKKSNELLKLINF